MAGHLKRKTNGHLLRNSAGHLVNSTMVTDVVNRSSYGFFSSIHTGFYSTVNDWDASASSLFLGVQGDTWADFNSETSLITDAANYPYIVIIGAPWGLGGALLPASFSIADTYPYVSPRCSVMGGYEQFYITDAQKAGITSLKIRFTPFLYHYYGINGNQVLFPIYQFLYNLKLRFTESPTYFSSGNALRTGSAHWTRNFTNIRQDIEAAGGSATTQVELSYTIPASYISGLSGNNLYLWAWITADGTMPFTSPWFANTTAQYPYIRGRMLASAINFKLEITHAE